MITRIITKDTQRYLLNDKGEIAILYSPGYGAGWYSWNKHKGGTAMLFDPEIAQAVLGGDREKAGELAAQKFPDAYLGGLDGLKVVWLPEGTPFRVREYNGSEIIVEGYREDYITAGV